MFNKNVVHKVFRVNPNEINDVYFEYCSIFFDRISKNYIVVCDSDFKKFSELYDIKERDFVCIG